MVRRNKTYTYAIYNLTKNKYLGTKREGGETEVKTYEGKRAAEVAVKRLQNKVPQFELEIRLYQDGPQT